MMNECFTIVRYLLTYMWDFATRIFTAVGALEWVVGGIMLVAVSSVLLIPATKGGIR